MTGAQPQNYEPRFGWAHMEYFAILGGLFLNFIDSRFAHGLILRERFCVVGLCCQQHGQQSRIFHAHGCALCLKGQHGMGSIADQRDIFLIPIFAGYAEEGPCGELVIK